MTDGRRIERHPARAGGVLALIVGAIAVGVVADADGQLLAIGVELLSLLGLSVGVWRLRAGDRVVGIPLAVAGSLGVPVAIGHGIVSAAQTTQLVELVPGLLGLGLMALGILPIRPGWSRVLVAAGAIGIGIAIVGSGVVYEAGRLRLLVALALAVVAWDAGEQAVTLGEQVGPRAESTAVVATHSAWSVGAGVVGVAAASGVYAVDVTGLPLVGVGLLLLAAVALATAAFT